MASTSALCDSGRTRAMTGDSVVRESNEAITSALFRSSLSNLRALFHAQRQRYRLSYSHLGLYALQMWFQRVSGGRSRSKEASGIGSSAE